jgi:hypothetical protein
MERKSKQLTAKLLKIRQAIKRKYKAFKDGMIESDIMLEKQYQPIIKELKKTNNINIKNDFKKEKEEQLKQEPASEMMDYESSLSEEEEQFTPNVVSTPNQLKELVSSPSDVVSTTQFINEYFENPITKEYMTSFIKDAGSAKLIDNVFGPRFEGNTLMIGSLPMDFDSEGNIIIGGVNYGASEGLYELIFKRVPDQRMYNNQDLNAYRSILNASNVYREGYKFNGKIKSSKAVKYTKIIKSLFPSTRSGKGMAWKSTRFHDVIHWDDPNELVNRLWHITMSTETGNRVHVNEILSIIEELREAGYIRGHGNSRFKALLQ